MNIQCPSSLRLQISDIDDVLREKYFKNFSSFNVCIINDKCRSFKDSWSSVSHSSLSITGIRFGAKSAENLPTTAGLLKAFITDH